MNSRHDNHNETPHDFGKLNILCGILFALYLGFLSPKSTAFAEGQQQQKRVLILYSFENDVGLYSDFDDSLRATLKAGEMGPIKFHTEFLDLARFPGPQHDKELQNMQREVYSGEKINLIIPASLPAINFILSHGGKLFPGVPAVFCAVDRRWIARLPLPLNTTGVVGITKINKTLAAAMQLQSDTRRVVVVGGTLPYERDWMREIQSDLRENEGHLEFTYLTDLPMDELLRRLANLVEHTIDLYMMMWRDGAGEDFFPKEALLRMVQDSNAPIYGFFDSFLGSGMVGGDLIPFKTAGAMAAQIGLQVLEGEKPVDIPILSEDNARNTFDWRQFRRWRISEKRLPPGGVVLFKESSTWELYKWRIIIVVLLIAVETMLITLLLIQSRKRTRAEQALHSSETRYRDLVESSHDWVWEVDSEGVYTVAGPQCRNILGYDPEEIIGKKPIDLMPPEEARRVGLAFGQIAAQRQAFRALENTYLHKDGRFVVLETNGVPIFNEQSNFRGYRGMDRDITKRKQSENELWESERKYRQLYESMIDGFVRVDMKGRITEFNDAFHKLVGYEPKELLKLAYTDLTPEKWHVFETDIVERQVRVKGYSEVYEKECRSKDGTIIPVELRTYFMRDEAGNPSGMWAIVRDITERKRAEKTLKEYEKAVESSQNMIAVVDREYRYLIANRSYLEHQGRERRQVIGHSVSEVLGDEFFERVVKKRLDECFAGNVARYEMKHQGARGERNLSASYFPMEGSGGIDRVCCVIQDITERKRAEAEVTDRLRFETLLAELSSRFVHVPGEQIDGEISHALRRVCETLGLEMSTLWRRSATTPGPITLTHFYGPAGGPPNPEQVNGEEHFPWCFRQATTGKVVAVSSLEELPVEAARDREGWRQYGIKSNLTIGLAVGGRSIVGALSFNTVQAERTWPEPLVKRLQMVAQMFSNALARQSAERALHESEEHFRSLVENATVGIYRTTPDGRILTANPTLIRMLGYPDFETLAGRNLEEDGFEPTYPREEFRERMDRDSQVIGLESAWTKQDGSKIFVRESARTIRGEDGNILYYDGIVEDVTERKQVEEALRESESHLKEAEQLAHLGSSSWEVASDKTIWSDELYRIVGRDPQQPAPSQKERAALYTPESWARLDWAVQRALETGEPYDLELEVVRPDGTRRHAHARGEAVRGDDGRVVRLHGTLQDITERKRAEEALRRQAAFNAMMTEVLNRFATCPPEEVDAAVVKALEAIAGFIGADHAFIVRFSEDWASWSATHEWCGPSVTPKIHQFRYMPMGTIPRNEQRLLAGLIIRINSPDDYPLDAVEERRAQDAEGHSSALTVPVRTKGGIHNCIGLHSHARSAIWSDDDVTHLRMVGDAVANALERKQSLDELRMSEEKFSMAFHGSPVAMTILSLATGRYIEVNKAYERNTGFRAEEVIGRTPGELGNYIYPADLERIRKAMSEQRRLGNMEAQYRTKAGDLRTVVISTELIEFGGEPCSLKVLEDITERKRIEKDLRELGARMLMVQEEERRRVARELHDDFSQRLALLAIDLEQMAQRPPATKQELSARIQAMWSQTQELTSDVHRLSYQLHPSKLEDLGLVLAVRSYCHELSRQAVLEVKFSDADVPHALPKEISLCIYRIVQEALRNVVKHSGVKTAAVDLSGAPNEVRLIVSDSGKGFAMDAARGGQGLGLVSMQERARHVGGEISVASLPSAGTRVEVRIPLPPMAARAGTPVS